MKYKLPVLSPTNVNAFKTCPKQYFERYITKSITFKPNPAMERGTELHKVLEIAVKKGWDDALFPKDEPDNVRETCQSTVILFDGLKNNGWEIRPEFEAAITIDGKPCDWWDKQAYMRCKIDLLGIPPDKSYQFINDYKTGKVREDMIQVCMNARCVTAFTEIKESVVNYSFLDHDTIVSDRIREGSPEFKKLDILLDKMYEAHATGNFVPNKNGLCKNYCDAFDCPYNGRKK